MVTRGLTMTIDYELARGRETRPTSFGILLLFRSRGSPFRSVCVACSLFARMSRGHYAPVKCAREGRGKPRKRELHLRSLSNCVGVGERQRADKLSAIVSGSRQPFLHVSLSRVIANSAVTFRRFVSQSGPFMIRSFPASSCRHPRHPRQTLPRRLCMSFAARTGMRSGMVARASLC